MKQVIMQFPNYDLLNTFLDNIVIDDTVRLNSNQIICKPSEIHIKLATNIFNAQIITAGYTQ